MLQQPPQPFSFGKFIKNAAIVIFCLLCVKWAAGYLGKRDAEEAFAQEMKEESGNRTGKMGLIAEISNETNKTLPKTIDSLTRLDSTAAALNRLQYHYTLVKTKLESIDATRFLSDMKPLLINQMKGNKFGQMLKDNSITVVHSYNDKNGKLVGSLEISPQEIP